ncbi:MAG: hypothetical protein HRT91_01835 [Piscirickettsiaceae bacterium]|nr:hypothetical protein [Piscirickettsiaceae bacterium]
MSVSIRATRLFWQGNQILSWNTLISPSHGLLATLMRSYRDAAKFKYFKTIDISPFREYINNISCRLHIGGQYNLSKQILRDILTYICLEKLK